jgi:DNA-binding MarR family transcriptional regulator
MQPPVKQCADDVLDVIPLIMRSIRAEMRSHRSPELSVPQFRALAFAGMHEGATLSLLADHLGLMPPAASKIVDGLVTTGLLERRANLTDRRRIWLALTESGHEKLKATHRVALECLAEMFAPLSKVECKQISNAMQQLRKLFLNAPKKRANGSAG